MDTRVKHIDIARGISIVLVAMFHSALKFFIPEVIYSMGLFRMPLFFFLSGVFFSYTPGPKEFFSKKSEALLKPYFSVLFLLFTLDFFFHDGNSGLYVAGILYGNGSTIRSMKWLQLWFLTHLFAVYCFCYLLFRCTRFSRMQQCRKWLFLILCLLLGAATIGMFWYQEVVFFNYVVTLPGLPFSIDLILITSAYFLSGHLLKEKVIQFSPKPAYFLLAIAVFIGITMYSGASTDLNNRVYASPLFATLGAVAGIYIVLCISSLFSRYAITKKVFLALGGASLYILIFHAWIGGTIYQYTTTNVTHDGLLLLLSITAFLLSISIPLLIQSMVRRNNFLALLFLPLKTNKLFQK